MNEINKNIVKMQSKFSQNCKSCSKLISLNEKITYLCTKCKMYFCEECALFLNQNEVNKINTCPWWEKDPHDSIMVKITRNIKEYLPIGISVNDLEKKVKNKEQENSTIKIIDSKTDESNIKKKSRVKILDD